MSTLLACPYLGVLKRKYNNIMCCTHYDVKVYKCMYSAIGIDLTQFLVNISQKEWIGEDKR